VVGETPEFEYAIETLPPSRIGWRWRWELWHGRSLVAAGWRLSPRHARDAVRVAALRRVHATRGVVPLPSALDGELRGGAVMDARGRVLCLLRAREAGLPGAAAA
jgi:hypothetical protein